MWSSIVQVTSQSKFTGELMIISLFERKNIIYILWVSDRQSVNNGFFFRESSSQKASNHDLNSLISESGQCISLIYWNDHEHRKQGGHYKSYGVRIMQLPLKNKHSTSSGSFTGPFQGAGGPRSFLNHRSAIMILSYMITRNESHLIRSTFPALHVLWIPARPWSVVNAHQAPNNRCNGKAHLCVWTDPAGAQRTVPVTKSTVKNRLIDRNGLRNCLSICRHEEKATSGIISSHCRTPIDFTQSLGLQWIRGI